MRKVTQEKKLFVLTDNNWHLIPLWASFSLKNCVECTCWMKKRSLGPWLLIPSSTDWWIHPRAFTLWISGLLCWYFLSCYNRKVEKYGYSFIWDVISVMSSVCEKCSLDYSRLRGCVIGHKKQHFSYSWSHFYLLYPFYRWENLGSDSEIIYPRSHKKISDRI